MGLRSIGHYCFPCWVDSDEDQFIKSKKTADPYAASDSFRQGEQYLFGLKNPDIEAGESALLKALECFENSRDFGSTIGAVVSGIFYECAINMAKPDYQKAFRYYEEASEQGDLLGRCLLASMPSRVEAGTIPGDYKHRKQILKEVSSSSFRSASQDPLRWLKEAADRYKVGEAIFLLGSCIEHGVGVSRADPITAVSLYKEAAKAGVKSARRTIARCYLQGNGVEKDAMAGKYWLIRAVKDNNDPEAMSMLAMNYENGVFAPEETDFKEFTDIDHSGLKSHVKNGQIVHISEVLDNNENINTMTDAADDITENQNDIDLEHVSWSSGPEKEIIQRIDRASSSRNERRDFRECFYWASRSAEIGCASGLYQLGRCYEVGLGVAINLERCFELYKAAVELGYAPAQFSLACFYCSGCIVEKRDSKKAHDLLSKAAESGYTPAMVSIATLYNLESKSHSKVIDSTPKNRYRDNLSTSLVKLRDPSVIAITMVDPDLQKSMIWWRRAAKRGSRQAQYELALCYRDGKGTQVDLVKALYWMRQAAEAGLAEAQLELGILLVQDLPMQEKSSRNTIEHDNNSFYWILRAAKNGLPEAQIELAQLFVEGRYVHRNTSTAFYWFKRAAKAGHPYAQFRVGAMLMDGEMANGCVGLQDSQAEAVKWLKLASEQGWTDADSVLPVALGMASEESVKTFRYEGKYIY